MQTVKNKKNDSYKALQAASKKIKEVASLVSVPFLSVFFQIIDIKNLKIKITHWKIHTF